MVKRKTPAYALPVEGDESNIEAPVDPPLPLDDEQPPLPATDEEPPLPPSDDQSSLTPDESAAEETAAAGPLLDASGATTAPVQYKGQGDWQAVWSAE